MKISANIKPIKTIRDYFLVNTCSNDTLNALANDARAAVPDCFDGECIVFFFFFRYYAPFEKDFNELRRIGFEARKHTRFKEEYNGYIAVDVSEWIGHEDEFYFDIILKYLYDQNDHWRYIFYTDDTQICDTKHMASLLYKFFLIVPMVAEPDHRRENSIKDELKERGIFISRETSCFLDDLREHGFMSKETLLGIIEDIRLRTNKHMIPSGAVVDYLHSNDGIHRLLLDNKQLIELNKLIEANEERSVSNAE